MTCLEVVESLDIMVLTSVLGLAKLHLLFYFHFLYLIALTIKGEFAVTSPEREFRTETKWLL